MDWRSILRACAPTIEGAIGLEGTPVAGMATKLLLDKLLGDKPNATAADLPTALMNASPEQILAIHQEDDNFKIKTQQMGLDIETLKAQLQEEEDQTDEADRGSARGAFAGIKFIPQMVLTTLVTLSLMWFVYLKATHVITMDTDTSMILTALIAVFMQQMNFWFGSTHGSQRKDETLAALAANPPGAPGS